MQVFQHLICDHAGVDNLSDTLFLRPLRITCRNEECTWLLWASMINSVYNAQHPSLSFCPWAKTEKKKLEILKSGLVISSLVAKSKCRKSITIITIFIYRVIIFFFYFVFLFSNIIFSKDPSSNRRANYE